MKNRSLMHAVVLVIMLFVKMPYAAADPILGVIDISAIRDRHPGGGNSLGVAYNPTSDVLYLSQFVTPSAAPTQGYIYTLDLQGNLLNELNFQEVYTPGSYPTSLSYDQKTGHLFVYAFGVGPEVGNFVEMSPDGKTIFNQFTVPLGGGGGIHVRDDGVWQSLFASDTIRHYTPAGTFIDELSVASSFPGFPGPNDLTSSFTGGFFLLDSFGSRVVEVDSNGNEVTSVSTASLGSSFLSIDSDISTQRVFLQNNGQIYILSSEFIQGVPEPSTLALLSIGSIGMVGYVLRQHKRAA